MSTNLYEASNQWAVRPADQRYETLDAMYDASRGYHASARVASIPYRDLELSDDDGELLLLGKERIARFTNWSFGQICSRVGAPAGYLRSVPASLAASCINHGLSDFPFDDVAQILMHENGTLLCRAFTSDDYSRIWNWEVIDRLRGLVGDGWSVPPARPAQAGAPGSRVATAADIGPRTINLHVGDTIAPAGLYASDHDMFAFLVNEQVTIDDGTPGGLARGVFVSNSEVGAAALKLTRFLYRSVCGNHIVWDAKDVEELRIVHRGNASSRYGYKLTAELRKYAFGNVSDDELRIVESKKIQIGQTKDEVLNTLFAKRLLPRKTLELAYDRAVDEADTYRDFSPRSVWGMVQGITAHSQTEQFAEKRVELDRAAGKLMSMSF
jgi:hypothetical protein